MSYSGTKLQTRRRARRFGFRNRLLKHENIIKSKRLKKRSQLAVVVKSQKQRLA